MLKFATKLSLHNAYTMIQYSQFRILRRLLSGKAMFVHVLNTCSIYEAHVLGFKIILSVLLSGCELTTY